MREKVKEGSTEDRRPPHLKFYRSNEVQWRCFFVFLISLNFNNMENDCREKKTHQNDQMVTRYWSFTTVMWSL